MPVHFTTATTDADLDGILTLQATNQKAVLSVAYQEAHGFVTLIHTPELLRQMNEAAPHILAKDGDRVVGYALTLVPALRTLMPHMASLFTKIDDLTYADQPLNRSRYYAIGQICVDEAYRGQGVFDGLYSKHRQQFAQQFDMVVTDIARRNTRSRRAHERIGFQEIYDYTDELDQWVIVVWDWRAI